LPNNSLEEDMVVKGPGNKNQQPDFGRYHHSTQCSSEKIREKIEVLFTEALDDLPFSEDIGHRLWVGFSLLDLCKVLP
jgi:hypothetical protein